MSYINDLIMEYESENLLGTDSKIPEEVQLISDIYSDSDKMMPLVKSKVAINSARSKKSDLNTILRSFVSYSGYNLSRDPTAKNKFLIKSKDPLRIQENIVNDFKKSSQYKIDYVPSNNKKNGYLIVYGS